VYYVWLNTGTLTDDFYPAEFPVEFSGGRDLLHFTFKSGDGKQKMLAAWVQSGGGAGDPLAEDKIDVTLPGIHPNRAWVIEVFNGTEQELDITSGASGAA